MSWIDDLRGRILRRMAAPIIRQERDDAARIGHAIGIREASVNDLYGYRRLTQDKASERLNPMGHEKLLELVRKLHAVNPLARRLVDIVVDFCSSVEVQPEESCSEEVRGVITDFWNDPYNNMPEFAPQLVERFYLDGEVLLPVDLNAQTGHVTVRFEDPANIESMEAIKGDLRYIDTVTMKREESDGDKGKKYDVVRFQPGVEYVTVGSAATGNEKLENAEGMRTGNCFYFRMGHLISGRGRPPLEPVIDWLDAHDRTFFDQLRNIALQDLFVFDVSLKGASAEGVLRRRQELAEEGPPKAGSIRVHNDGEEWQAVAPDIKPAITSEILVQTRKLIGLGAGGRSEVWIAASDDVNRSTADAADTPPLRNLERLQATFERMFAFMVDYAIDQAILHGTIQKPATDAERAFRIVTPDLSAADNLKTAQALQSLVPALDVAEQRGYCDKQTARRMFFMTAGEEMPEDMDEVVTKQAEDDAAEDYRAVPPPMSPTNGRPTIPAGAPATEENSGTT